MLNIPCLQPLELLSRWLIRHLPTITVPKCKRPSKSQVPSGLPTVFYVEKDMSIAWLNWIKVITYGLPFQHKQPIFVHPPRESICTPRLIVVIQSLIEKNVKSVHGDMWILKKEDVSNLSHNYHAFWTIRMVVGSRRMVYLISTTSHGDPRISGLK